MEKTKAIYLREGKQTELLQLMSKAKTEAEKVEIFRAYEPKEKRRRKNERSIIF
jgi:hypothetical protein